MRNILIVLKHEFITTISKASFWVMTFIFPAVVIGLSLGSQIFAQSNMEVVQANNPMSGAQSTTSASGPQFHYVDLSGIIQSLPEDVPSEMLKAYPDVESAQAALQAGEIESYAIIPTDYVETGNLELVQRVFNPMGTTPEEFYHYLIGYNLAPDRTTASILARDYLSTMQYDLAPVEPGATDAEVGSAGMLVSYGTLFIFFMLLTMSSSLMLSSVSKEKSNRIAEVLLLSLRPQELMAGKLFGLSLVALFQMVAWVGGAMLFLDQGKNIASSLALISLPEGFLLWAIFYFFLGYLLYGSLMGAIGALAPDLREAGQFTFILLLPLMVPVFLNTVFAEAPNGSIATFLSLFPLTAPTAMMTRLASAPVPLWQTAASLGGLALATALVVLLSGRFFRPETLLSTSSIKWKNLVSELRHAVTGRS